jgi:hypothetical protein
MDWVFLCSIALPVTFLGWLLSITRKAERKSEDLKRISRAVKFELFLVVILYEEESGLTRWINRTSHPLEEFDGRVGPFLFSKDDSKETTFDTLVTNGYILLSSKDGKTNTRIFDQAAEIIHDWNKDIKRITSRERLLLAEMYKNNEIPVASTWPRSSVLFVF